ncbi:MULTISPECIES: DUF4864 domain-containing protein [unclassified Roseitalea]|uniref:DUF4864 domain-containing protein n=1 Tax=unclassified Roseitalea TaxID=2639107 RepID=UPI00273E8116|nr:MULTISPECIES: DUF4864 domain-containing protein [unclassified Roseitalea]
MPNRPRLVPLVMAVASTIALAIAFILSPAQARADEAAARTIITEQLESFLSGDFPRAYSYASPDIKRIFPTLDRFMSMVQTGYLPVLRPGNYAFGEVRAASDGRIVQDVLIQGPDGRSWTATYFMELQDDGTWKVDGVQLREGAAGMT